MTSDVTHEYPLTKHLPVPAEVKEVQQVFSELEKRALEEMMQEGFSGENMQFHRSVGMRFRLQMHEVITPIPAQGRITAKVLEETYQHFEDLYEQKFGKGSAYKDAGMEIISFHLKAVGKLRKPALRTYEKAGPNPEKALVNRRVVLFDGSRHDTGVYRYDLLNWGNEIAGPAIVVTPVTTIVIQPNQKATLDAYKNVIIPFEEPQS